MALVRRHLPGRHQRGGQPHRVQDPRHQRSRQLPYYPGGEFSVAYDITGYDAAAEGNDLAVRGLRGTDSVSVVTDVFEMQVERILTESVEVTSKGTWVTATVRDTVGDYFIAGAEVRRLSDGSLVGYTDGRGRVRALQPNETTESYYVNTTDTDAYEPGVDRIVEVTTPAYVPVATDAEAVLADGDVFDDDEYRKGDIAIQLLDQEGTPLRQAGVPISYALHRAGTPRPELTDAETDARGRVVVPFDPKGEDGRYRLVHAFGGPDGEAVTTTFVAGDARLRLTPARGQGALRREDQVRRPAHHRQAAAPRPPHRPALPARHRDQARAQGRRRHQGRRQAQARREGPHPQERHLHRRRDGQGRTRPARRERPTPRHRQDRQGAGHRPRHVHPEASWLSRWPPPARRGTRRGCWCRPARSAPAVSCAWRTVTARATRSAWCPASRPGARRARSTVRDHRPPPADAGGRARLVALGAGGGRHPAAGARRRSPAGRRSSSRSTTSRWEGRCWSSTGPAAWCACFSARSPTTRVRSGGRSWPRSRRTPRRGAPRPSSPQSRRSSRRSSARPGSGRR
ncbi:hypothetical protein [Nocardioides sp. TF02-7]|uniref:hypothetical protein n=1 Tax=Nocardioides sp. TF02-7 TaxID=2917724 RepID=UPI001F06DD17|nr:hypothetical protein [Nocardioides sp. TF02-7]UMG93758.1 hypothetical protein MF408_06260 [Nocardioides sp. TF02-7]